MKKLNVFFLLVLICPGFILKADSPEYYISSILNSIESTHSKDCPQKMLANLREQAKKQGVSEEIFMALAQQI